MHFLKERPLQLKNALALHSSFEKPAVLKSSFPEKDDVAESCFHEKWSIS